MTHGPPPSPVIARAVQMNLMRASPPVLLLATAMAIMSLCQLINRSEAGGKGKGGRQGHIIIQNEVKSNPVPVYMPIPIPIPMPMGGGGGGGGGGPPPNHGKPPGYHNHHDGEGEVRKIYLLQPMAPARPQPHLKGGGFMGVPVQNNIHLGPGMAHHQLSMMSPGKHRHGGHGGGGGGKTSLTFDSFSEQQQQVPIQQHEEHKHVKSSASEVKILPIVVIPPMAPMPPIQVPSGGHHHHQQQQAASHAPRMTLTPQFNNYVLAAGAGSHDRRRSSGGGGGHSRGGHYRAESLSADYGGSLGGSMFRERFAGAKLRPVRARTFQRIVAESEIADRRQRLPTHSSDFDYGDDYDQQGSGSGGAELRALEELVQQQQQQRRSASNRWRRGGDMSSQQQRHQRIKSIRDIIDQAEQDEAATGVGGIDEFDGQRHLPAATRGDQADGSDPLMLRTVGGTRSLRAPGSTGTMEISMDELSLAAASSDLRTGGSSSQQDLSALYYDRQDSPPSTADGHRGRLRSPSSLSPGNFRLPRTDERDLFDDETDEWRFDTLKSVRHAAPNETVLATGSKNVQSEKGAINLVTPVKLSSLRNQTERVTKS